MIPAVPYLQSLGLSREQMIQALGLSFTVSTLALAVGLAGQDALGGQALGASLLMLAPALLGMLAGQWLRQRISALLFKRCFFIGLAALGGRADQRLALDALSMSTRWISKSRSR